MRIFIDDLRSVDMSHNPNKGLGLVTDFVIARDDKDFIKLVDENINDITLVSFDHDLACWVDGNEFTGKTACEYLIDKCLEVGRKFGNINLTDEIAQSMLSDHPQWAKHFTTIPEDGSGRLNHKEVIVPEMSVEPATAVQDKKKFAKKKSK